MLTDEKILKLCRIYGERAKYYRQKFIGLLPEVYRRKLYEKAGCSSVFEFGKKLAGLSEQQVSRTLNLEQKFQDKPDLHKALVNGEVSMNKLARVASIATQGNDEFLAQQAKVLSKNALEVFVRDYRNNMLPSNSELQKTIFDEAFVPGHKSLSRVVLLSKLKLSDAILQKLVELQERGVDIEVLIQGLIEKREREIAEEKEILAQEQNLRNSASKKTSRYIPRKIEKIIQKEYGSKCAIPNCDREAEQIHHEIPFTLLQNHNPYFLKPLCKEHHIVVHGIHLVYEKMRKANLEKH